MYCIRSNIKLRRGSGRSNFLLVLVGTILILAPVGIQAQAEWTKHPSNPVLEAGPAGSWDCWYLLEPCVIRVGDTYKMWYQGAGSVEGPTGYAESVDGITWTKYDDTTTTATSYATSDPVLQPGPSGSFDDVIASNPSVVFDGTTYHMWYGAYDGVTARIGYTTSPDGINWVRGSLVLSPSPYGRWDDDDIGTPVVILVDSTYMMWYFGEREGTYTAIGLATSSDGITWTKDGRNPVINPNASGWEQQGLYPQSVIYDGAVYHMWYLGLDANWKGRTGHATSLDGITWTKDTLNPVLDVGAPGAWDDVSVAAGTVLFDGTHYHLWYDSWDGVEGVNGEGSIGYATTDSSLVEIAERGNAFPLSFMLYPAYPNPFNPSSTIRYDLRKATDVSLVVYDISGREVARLVDGYMEPGYHEIQWDGQSYPSGIYFARLVTPESSKSIKMVLLK